MPTEAPASTSEVAPPRTRARMAVLGACLALGLTALLAPRLATEPRTLVREHGAAAAERQATPEADAPKAAAIAPGARADAELDRASLNPISGGFINIPSTFSSDDGEYDLVIHFHGVDKLVQQSFEHAGLNAVVATINLGIGSAGYVNQFSSHWALEGILDRAQSTLEKRGLRGARLRRLAISAFSAGYGAARGILSQPAFAEKVDAVLLLDGIHTGYLPVDHTLDMERLMPFVRFAAQAAVGKKLFSITHSEITPNADYAGTHESTDAVLGFLHMERVPAGDAPAVPVLPAMANVARLAPLLPLSEAHQGSFFVRGYAGTQKQDHVMQFAQMSETAVPDLVRYWSTTRRP